MNFNCIPNETRLGTGVPRYSPVIFPDIEFLRCFKVQLWDAMTHSAWPQLGNSTFPAWTESPSSRGLVDRNHPLSFSFRTKQQPCLILFKSMDVIGVRWTILQEYYPILLFRCCEHSSANTHLGIKMNWQPNDWWYFMVSHKFSCCINYYVSLIHF